MSIELDRPQQLADDAHHEAHRFNQIERLLAAIHRPGSVGPMLVASFEKRPMQNGLTPI